MSVGPISVHNTKALDLWGHTCRVTMNPTTGTKFHPKKKKIPSPDTFALCSIKTKTDLHPISTKTKTNTTKGDSSNGVLKHKFLSFIELQFF